MNGRNISEITTTRGFAIIAVVVIHGTASLASSATFGLNHQLIYFLMNKMASFSVPAFILLSGFVLCFRYSSLGDKHSIMNFYKKRYKYLLVPYILWSLLYHLYHHFGKHESYYFWLKNYIEETLTGAANYHLYFVPLLAQYYLLTPFLLRLIHRFHEQNAQKAPHFLLSLTILFQIIIGWVNQTLHVVDDRSILSTTYMIFFVLGGYMGIHYERYSKWIKQKRFILYGLTFFLLCIHIGKYLFVLHGWVFNPLLSDVIVQLYCLAVTLSLIELSKEISAFPPASKTINALGKFSYIIYLSHPFVLSLCDKILPFSYQTSCTLLSIMLGLALPLLFGILCKRWNRTWLLIGR